MNHFRKFLPDNQKKEEDGEAEVKVAVPVVEKDYSELERQGWSQQRIRAQKLRDGVAVCSRSEIYAKLPQPEFDLKQQIASQSQSEASEDI